MNRLQADLLVVGGGMAGLSAAASAVRDGLSVVLVEKGELGGSAARAGFLWTGPTDAAPPGANPGGGPGFGRQLIDGFPSAVEWVRSTGVEVQPPVTVLRFGRGHQVSLPSYLHACEVVIGDDDRSDLIVGGDTRRLLFEDGVVRGAEIALPSGETLEVHAG